MTENGLHVGGDGAFATVRCGAVVARWSRGGTSVYARFAAPLCRGDSDHLGEGGREDAVFADGVTHHQCPVLRTGRGKKCELRVKSSAPSRVC